MGLPYKAGQGCVQLNSFFVVNSGVQMTSVEAYDYLRENGVTGTQISAMLEVYCEHPEGVSDERMRDCLALKGLMLDKSTVSARRNDINKQHLAWCDKNHFFSDQLIKSFPTRIINNTGRSALVWGLARNMRGVV